MQENYKANWTTCIHLNLQSTIHAYYLVKLMSVHVRHIDCIPMSIHVAQ